MRQVSRTEFRAKGLTELPRRAQDEREHLGNGAVERLGDRVLQFDVGERLGERGILFQRDAVGAGRFDDAAADLAAPLGDHSRRARLLIMQRDGERRALLIAHDARSRKRPAADGGAAGAPMRNWMSRGSSAAARSASSSRPLLARRCAALASRSAHRVTAARPPARAMSAWAGPMGSTLTENRTRQVKEGSVPAACPSRVISNWAIALPCARANGISNAHCAARAVGCEPE